MINVVAFFETSSNFYTLFLSSDMALSWHGPFVDFRTKAFQEKKASAAGSERNLVQVIGENKVFLLES